MKKRKTFIAKHNGLMLTIQEDNPDVGFYLIVGNEIGGELYDYLQDTVDMCKDQAFEEFGVPYDKWQPGEDIIIP